MIVGRSRRQLGDQLERAVRLHSELTDVATLVRPVKPLSGMPNSAEFETNTNLPSALKIDPSRLSKAFRRWIPGPSPDGLQRIRCESQAVRQAQRQRSGVRRKQCLLYRTPPIIRRAPTRPRTLSTAASDQEKRAARFQDAAPNSKGE